MEHCITCKKELEVGDTAYIDSYFGSHYCSWEHAIFEMAEFFGLTKGETEPLQEEFECATCHTVLKEGEQVYQDGYFGCLHCSWEHAVTFMAEFFGLEEGNPDVVEAYVPKEPKKEKTYKWGEDL